MHFSLHVYVYSRCCFEVFEEFLVCFAVSNLVLVIHLHDIGRQLNVLVLCEYISLVPQTYDVVFRLHPVCAFAFHIPTDNPFSIWRERNSNNKKLKQVPGPKFIFALAPSLNLKRAFHVFSPTAVICSW